jgi:phenylalanine-4-hydroxylase
MSSPPVRPGPVEGFQAHGTLKASTGSARTEVVAPLAPVIFGASERPPRGDYTRARPDYTCEQTAHYSQLEHDIYHRLYSRQSALLPGLACDEFIAALPHLGARDRIPRFEAINEQLYKATRWEIVAVPGLIPEVPFFTLLANRKFPVTDWIRTPAELDYIVEPDVFHDLFGHVPLLFNPAYADHIQAYGVGALKAHGLGACEQLSRLYWYTIEFGLVQQQSGLRAYGAGILSSGGELQHSVRSPEPQRLMLRNPAELVRCMRTRYKIDSYQQTYFAIESFEQLMQLTAPDFTPLYAQVRALPELAADARLPENRCIN